MSTAPRIPAPRRRLLVLTALTLAAAGSAAGVASGAVQYQPGTYEAGNPEHSDELKAYTQMTVRRGHFEVIRTTFPLSCKEGSRRTREQINFRKRGRNVRLTGPINSNGAFSGTYRELGAEASVQGTVRGSTAKVVVRMVIDFAPGSTDRNAKYCSGRMPFTLRLRR